MITKNTLVKTNHVRLAALAISVLSLAGCASSGGYSNSTDNGYGYGKTVKAAAAAEPVNSIAAPLSKVDSSIGPVIGGGPENKTLYFFDKDLGDTSTCYESCAAAWPPFLVADASLSTAKLTVTERNDGSKQWAIGGKPVYFWAGDQKAGDATGAAVPDWTVVTPDAL